MIELLVVIAIISILAAILFPVFSSAREKARQTSCASNLHQIGLGFIQYEQDFDEMLPPYESGTSPNNYATWWGTANQAAYPTTYTLLNGIIQPYMKSVQIQACPSLDNAISTNIGLTGYGYNAQYLSPMALTSNSNCANNDGYGDCLDSNNNYYYLPVNLNKVQVPTTTVLLADSGQIDYTTGKLKADPFLDPPSSGFPNFHALHNGLGNILWVDGHVKSMVPAYRSLTYNDYGTVGFTAANLGEIDSDKNLCSDELFNGTGSTQPVAGC